MKKTVVALLFLISTAAWAGDSATRSADIERIQSASTILSQIMDAPDKAIPDSIISGAKCIAIIPSNLKISFIFGANYGKGVATCRTAKGWSSPVFFRMTGGSFGFQAGGQASDLVLIIRTDDGMQHMLQSKFKLGADASASAGPVGRDAQAATDLTMRAQVLTYSRSRGLFLGVSLAGAVIRQDAGDTMAFYGKDYTFYSVLNGQVPPPQDAQLLIKTVQQYAPIKLATLTQPITPIAATSTAPLASPASTTTPGETPAETPAKAPAENVEPAETKTPTVPAESTPAATTTATAAEPTPGSHD